MVPNSKIVLQMDPLGQAMPLFFFGGKRLDPPGVAGVSEGDIIVVYTDPEARLVEFLGSPVVPFPLFFLFMGSLYEIASQKRVLLIVIWFQVPGLRRFYCNEKMVGSTESLGVPLPQADGRPLWMYAMVDDVGDEIKIKRFGPGRPYP